MFDRETTLRHPRSGRATMRVGPQQVAADLVAKSSLTRVDYVDHVAVAPGGRRATPEQWARAIFGDAPDLLERLLWTGVLGLRLRAGASADTIAGWTITGRGDDWIRISAASRSASAELIVQVTEEALGLTTTMQHERARASAIWVPASAVHRRLVPVALRSAVRRMAGRR